jgi:hypothetical protein
LNWNCRGIAAKLSALPAFLNTHDIHIAKPTETRRFVGTYNSPQEQRIGGYTFYFFSYKDVSHSTSYLNSYAREWGVCIAVRTGLAYESLVTQVADFDARLQHGIIKTSTPSGRLININLLVVYAPLAISDQKDMFFSPSSPSTSPICSYRHPAALNDNHLILAGDSNSYIDVERDI